MMSLTQWHPQNQTDSDSTYSAASSQIWMLWIDSLGSAVPHAGVVGGRRFRGVLHQWALPPEALCFSSYLFMR